MKATSIFKDTGHKAQYVNTVQLFGFHTLITNSNSILVIKNTLFVDILCYAFFL